MRLERFFFSHYLYTGIGSASGVFLVGLIGYLWGGWLTTAALTTGASSVHFVDNPCPPGKQKRNQLLLPLIASTAITLLTLLCQPLWLQLSAVLLITIASSMLSALGKSMMPFSFSLLYSMMMAMATPVSDSLLAILKHTALFASGAILYSVYVYIKEYMLEIRTKQQILAEAIEEFATYLKRQAQLYGNEAVPDAILTSLVRQQAVLAEKLQATRDILFQRIRSEQDKTLVRKFFILLDAYENALSSHSELIKLAPNYGSSDVLSQLGLIVHNCAHDLFWLSAQIMRNVPSPPLPGYEVQLTHLKETLLTPNTASIEDQKTLSLQIRLLEQTSILLYCIKQLAQPTPCPSDPTAAETLINEKTLTAFVSPDPLQMRMVRPHLDWNAPAARYTLRMTMAMIVAFSLANSHFLPYNAHSYWIILSLAVILRSSYSQTKQRSADRITGTLLGCLIGGLLLYVFDQSLPVLLGALFLSIAIARAMVTLRYRYASAAATIMGMIQIHMLNPGAQFLAGERLIDTLLGAALAYLFSFVLPNWEHRNLPALARRLATNFATYAKQALALSPDQTQYRLARRSLLDTLAIFSQTTDRMLDEPRSRQIPILSLEATTTRGYRLAAHMTALHSYLMTHRLQINPEHAISEIDAVCNHVIHSLEAPFIHYPIQPAPDILFESDDIHIQLQHLLKQIDYESEQFSYTLYRLLKSYRRILLLNQ